MDVSPLLQARRGSVVTQPAGRQTRRAMFCVLALLALAGCAARAPARTFSDLQQRLKPDATVYVIDSTGSETKGTIVNVTPSALTLEVDGVQRRMEQETVRQVQTYGDSVWNGLLIGMAVATPGMLMADPTYEPCPDNAQLRCANAQVGQRILAVGIMGGVGAGIDALIRGRHQVYLAAGHSTGFKARVSVTPRVGASTAALFVTVRP